MRLPGAHQLFTMACDLGRSADGEIFVLSDRAQGTVGRGLRAGRDRIVTSRVLPSLYRDAEVHRLAPFFRTLRSSLQGVAPEGVTDPRIVVLSPGARSETAFEPRRLLAPYLGYYLVEGSDLDQGVARHVRMLKRRCCGCCYGIWLLAGQRAPTS